MKLDHSSTAASGKEKYVASGGAAGGSPSAVLGLCDDILRKLTELAVVNIFFTMHDVCRRRVAPPPRDHLYTCIKRQIPF